MFFCRSLSLTLSGLTEWSATIPSLSGALSLSPSLLPAPSYSQASLYLSPCFSIFFSRTPSSPNHPCHSLAKRVKFRVRACVCVRGWRQAPWWTSPECRHFPVVDLISGQAWQPWVAACFFWLHFAPCAVSRVFARVCVSAYVCVYPCFWHMRAGCASY